VSDEVVFDSASADATEGFASRVATLLEGGELLALAGPLGAGKTCFVRGLARGLGADPRRVRSPSFTIHHRYAGGRLVLDHYDAYFVREGAEFARDGLFEQLADGHVAVVEWADRFPAELAHGALTVEIEIGGESERRLRLRGPLAARLRPDA
jgi:tRNA threonylcarbamoyladenosine biosynthesis protein TsaE